MRSQPAFEGSTTANLPPGPGRGVPGLSLYRFRRNGTGFLQKLAREYGDISSFKMGPQQAFFLNHPDYVKDVLVTNNQKFMKGRALQRSKRLLGEGLLTSEGEFHRRQRRLAQPAFHRQRINAYGTVMSEFADRAQGRWREGETVDISQEMMRLTLAIVGKTLFNADVEEEAGEIGEALTAILEMFNLMVLPFSEFLEKLPLPQNKRFYRARSRLDATIFRMIEERRRSGKDAGDLLSMLLLAQDEEGDGGQMTDEQVRDEAMTIFLAGHETTANALAWTWYLLSQNPSVEERLHREIDQVLAGRLPTVEDVPNLIYTEMVLSESMRLYPPAWAIGRLCLEDHTIGGYSIPKGSLVILSQYVTHRDARFYPDPDRFDPERWTPENSAGRPQYAYFPFGGGPRRCIGEGFAWMEGILLLATIARGWRMHLVPGHPVELNPIVTLRAKHGIRVTLEKRSVEGWGEGEKKKIGLS